jgi:hypothetical protein
MSCDANLLDDMIRYVSTYRFVDIHTTFSYVNRLREWHPLLAEEFAL